MPSPFVYRLINGYINGSTIKVGQGRKAFFGFAPTIDTEPFLFYGFTPTIDIEPSLLRFSPDFAPISDREPQKRHLHTQVP